MEKPKDMLQPATGLYAELASNAPKLSSVEDLERRLKLLGNTTQPPPAAPAAPAPTTFVAPAPAAVAAPSVAKTTATTMGGKAALLVSGFFLSSRDEVILPTVPYPSRHLVFNIYLGSDSSCEGQICQHQGT